MTSETDERLKEGSKGRNSWGPARPRIHPPEVAGRPRRGGAADRQRSGKRSLISLKPFLFLEKEDSGRGQAFKGDSSRRGGGGGLRENDESS